MRYLEDLAEGDTFGLSGWTVTRAEIHDFAKRWDPQPFHIDEEAARDSMFGGIVASGLHTMAIAIRLANRDFYHETAALGGLGIDAVSIPTPVRPGDTISGEVEVVESRVSASDDSRGIVQLHFTMHNQDGEEVLDMDNAIIVARRTASK